MSLKWILLLPALAITSNATVAQQASAPVVRDPQAVLILERAITAMGGRASVAALTDVVATGTVTLTGRASDPRGPGTFLWEDNLTDSLHNFRKETRYADGSNNILVSKDGQASRSRPGAAPETYGSHVALANPPFHMPLILLLRHLDDPTYSFTLRGSSTTNGLTIVDVHAESTKNPLTTLLSPQDWYFDAATGLPVSVDARFPETSHAFTYTVATVIFADYRSVQGLLVPFRLQIDVKQIKASTTIYTLQTVEFNHSLSSSEFEIQTGAGL